MYFEFEILILEPFLSYSISLIVLFKSVCELASLTGFIKTETFISPKEEPDSISEKVNEQTEALSDTLDGKSQKKKGNFIYRFFKKMDEPGRFLVQWGGGRGILSG